MYARKMSNIFLVAIITQYPLMSVRNSLGHP